MTCFKILTRLHYWKLPGFPITKNLLHGGLNVFRDRLRSVQGTRMMQLDSALDTYTRSMCMSMNGKSALLKEILKGQFGPEIRENHPDIPLLKELEADCEIVLEYKIVEASDGSSSGLYVITVLP